MSDHFKHIYTYQADLYDELVSREDQRGNLFAALNEIADPGGKIVADLGAGTGRVARLLSFLAQRVIACDISLPMLQIAQQQLTISGMDNVALVTAENRLLPLPDACVDVAVEGWSFGHAVGWHPATWRQEVQRMLDEMHRILRPGGTLVLIETLGTGSKSPEPPTSGLAELYKWWESIGFQHRWIRTDYQFEDLEEAEKLTRFFFGDALADQVVRDNRVILPECTGLWWQTV